MAQKKTADQLIKSLIFDSDLGYINKNIFSGKISNNIPSFTNNFCYYYEVLRTPTTVNGGNINIGEYKYAIDLHKIIYNVIFCGYLKNEIVIDDEDIVNEDYVNPANAGSKFINYLKIFASDFIRENKEFDSYSIGEIQVMQNITSDFDNGNIMQQYKVSFIIYMKETIARKYDTIKGVNSIIRRV